MQHLTQDLRYAFRTLFKHPASTLIALLALSLGIGANTAIFSVINAVLMRPLQYRDSSHIVVISGTKVSKGMIKQPTSPLDYRDFAAWNRSFDRIGAFHGSSSVLTGNDLPERLQSAAVSPDVFRILGLRPAIGRIFAPNEDQPGQNHVAVLSDGLWKRRFGADRKVLGTQLTLDGQSFTVIGIAAPDFHLLDDGSELWIPYTPAPSELASTARGYRMLKIIAHLKPGTTVSQAQSDVTAIARRLAETYPDTNGGFGASVVTLSEQMIGNFRTTLWTLLGAVLFVLLIACANVANLLLSRAGTREKEIAIRTSVGANSARLLRQLLTESIVLALMGGIFGLALAYAGVYLLTRVAPVNSLPAAHIAIDGRVLVFTLLLSFLTGILFGLAPALSSVKLDLNSVLKTNGRGTIGNRKRSAMRDLLVVSEIACCVVLLIGATLLMRSFLQLQKVNPGFRADHVLTMNLTLPEARYSGLKVGLFYKQLLERLERLPGVQSAAINRYLPLSGTDASLNFQIEGHPTVNASDQPRAKFRATSADYFRTMRIPLLHGRYFDATDDQRTPKVVLINMAAVKRYFPDEDPVGKRILSGIDETNWSTIIGVVGNVKHSGLDAETNPETYYNFLQVPPEVMNFVEGTMAVVIRTSQNPNAIIGAVRNEVRSLDAGLPIFNVQSMDDVVQKSVAQPRFRSWLLGTLAGLALLLAAVGLYGVISYSVTQRTTEIGIRSALGAERNHILVLVVAHGFRLAAFGTGIGLILTFGLTRLVANLLFGVGIFDPLSFLGTPTIIVLVALLASYLPALRATKVDPLIALRAG